MSEKPLWARQQRKRTTQRNAQLDRATKRKIDRHIARRLDPEEAQPPKRTSTPAFRFRHQLMPLWWLGWAAAGVAAHYQHTRTSLTGPAALAAVLVAAVTVMVQRHKPPWPRNYHQAMAVWCGLWLVAGAAIGKSPLLVIELAGWAIPSAVWVARYRWQPAAAEPGDGKADHAVFAELAETRKWAARLGPSRSVPNGVQYPILCRGAHTHIGQITTEGKAIAAAFDAPVTVVYAERDPGGVESRGLLTKLRTGTLDQPRVWDGEGIRQDGLAMVGRFPDGKPLRERVFVPGEGGGARHTIVAGADGSGKTGLLDLGLCNSAISGRIAPVILDPQEGQALPAWREHVPYARGTEQCLSFLTGLEQAMMSRSRVLGEMEWTSQRTGRTRRGMGFYDYGMCGLPIIEITIDEAPILLAEKDAVRIIKDIGKLGRKVGFRLRLAAQVPSLKELGGEQALRSMLVGGNVFCFRTGDKLSGSMVNIDARPWELPKYFTDGMTPTAGLCYADGPDARSSVTARTDFVPDPYEIAESTQICPPDADVASHLAGALSQAALSDSVTAGRVSAQMAVMAEIDGREVPKGELVANLVRQADGWKLSEVVDAITVLTRAGKISESPRGLEKT